jgi:hypothetical protein
MAASPSRSGRGEERGAAIIGHSLTGHGSAVREVGQHGGHASVAGPFRSGEPTGVTGLLADRVTRLV